jgi:hypothetical protein
MALRSADCFLAFPAFFPASATILESHEKKRKHRTGGNGTLPGKKRPVQVRLGPPPALAQYSMEID